MTKSKDGSIRFKFTDDGGAASIKSKISEKFGKVLGRVEEEVEKNFGKGYVRENFFESGLVFRNTRKLNRGKLPGNEKFQTEITELYAEEWEKRYEEFQKAHAALPIDRPTSHQKYKQANQGGDAYHNDRKINYTERTLWTGLMYEEILEAFETGGNQYLQTMNLLVSGGFNFDKSEFPMHYFKYFTPWFRKKGVIKGGEDIVELSPNRWNSIVDSMIGFLKKGFVKPMVEIMNRMRIEV